MLDDCFLNVRLPPQDCKADALTAETLTVLSARTRSRHRLERWAEALKEGRTNNQTEGHSSLLAGAGLSREGKMRDGLSLQPKP